jgi:hypothetical protein
MNAKLMPLVLVLALLPVPSIAQESVRNLKGTGAFGAFLTPGQIDRWVFDGEEGETIVAHVVSNEFDPILQLAKSGPADNDKVLIEVDDPGNESRYMIRLPEKGQYKIRVHAYQFQGGGNYKLTVRRFQAQPLAVGKPALGTFDRDGKSHYYFKGAKDQIMIPQLKGTPAEAWTVLDRQGRDLPKWAGTVHVNEDGECALIASGSPEYRFDLLLREARQRELDGAPKKAVPESLQQGEMDVLSFSGKAGDFRVVEVEKKGELVSQLKFAPLDKKNGPRIARTGERPEIEFLPVASRGSVLRYAAMLGRTGRYQLQLLATTPGSYKVTLKDPSVPIELGKDIDGNLPVGGSAFYSFKTTPGQLLHANLASQKFVPHLRLYDSRGSLVGSSEGEGDGDEGRLTHMALSGGTYRLQVSSLGDGGGGDFRQALKETKLKELKIGGKEKGTIQPGATDFWVFTGKSGQTVFLNVRSAAFEPSVSLRSPDGVHLAADNKGNAATGSLIAMKLPKTGRYTVWIASSRGAGDYTVRLIDGD